MEHYIELFLEMISFRGLTANTLKSYKSYIKSYLNYLETQLKKIPDDVSWEELRAYLTFIKQSRSLSDRTINAHISVLRFFWSTYFTNLGIGTSCLSASLIHICQRCRHRRRHVTLLIHSQISSKRP